MGRAGAALILLTLTCTIAVAASPDTAHTLSLDEGERGAIATIADIAWLAGSWEGEAFGGTCEEVWTAPSAGTMMGLYKLIQQDRPAMYEMFIVTEDTGSLVLKLKHFNPGFDGWEKREEYVTFPLVRIEPGAAYFDGLTYVLKGEREMDVYLSLRRGDELNEAHFLYRRTSP